MIAVPVAVGGAAGGVPPVGAGGTVVVRYVGARRAEDDRLVQRGAWLVVYNGDEQDKYTLGQVRLEPSGS